MLTASDRFRLLGSLALVLAATACGPPEGGETGAEADQPAHGVPPVAEGESALPEGLPVSPGDSAMILMEDGSAVFGYAIMVRRGDGTLVPGVFRGPARLAEFASGGDFEFHEDSIPSRVRLLGPGERMTPWDGTRR